MGSKPQKPSCATKIRFSKNGKRIDPARIRNLKPPWKPGESGNPSGRPVGSGVSFVLRKRSDMMREEDGDDRPLCERMADVIIDAALKGDVRFVGLFLERTEGKVADRIAGYDGGPLGAESNRREVAQKIMEDPVLLDAAMKIGEQLERAEDGNDGGDSG